MTPSTVVLLAFCLLASPAGSQLAAARPQQLAIQDWAPGGLGSLAAARPSWLHALLRGGQKDLRSDTWTDCGEEDDVLHIKEIKLTPDPPERGKGLHIEAVLQLDEDVVEGAKANVRVRLGVIKLLDKEFNLCEELGKQGNEAYKCPIKAGKIIVSENVDIPNQIPQGRYTVNTRARNADGKQLACVNARVNF